MPSPSRFRSLLSLVLVVPLAGCYAWQLTPQSPEEAIVDDRGEPRDVRVTTRDGLRIHFWEPGLRNDSIVENGSRSGPRPVPVALADVTSVEIHRFSTTRTVVAAAGVTLVAVVVAGAMEGDDPPRQPAEPISCPLVYSWNGEGWRLDSGTFGGAILPALARTDVDNLDHVSDDRGVVRLRVANELMETDHVDLIRVIAVDHEAGVSVAPGPEGSPLAWRGDRAPDRAVDDAGRDVLPRVASADGWSWESDLRIRDAGDPEELSDGIELTFDRPAGARRALLIVDGRNSAWASSLLVAYMDAHGRELDAWFAHMEAHPSDARRLGERFAREGFLKTSVHTPEGWRTQGLLWEAGPEVVKRQVMPLDLTGAEGSTVRVRLEAPPAFWLIDRVAIAWDVAADVSIREVRPRADHAAAERLAEADGRHLVLETGDAVELSFPVPPPAVGRDRTYLLRSHGWYRVERPGVGEPDRALLRRLEEEPGALARIAVERLNAAVGRLVVAP